MKKQMANELKEKDKQIQEMLQKLHQLSKWTWDITQRSMRCWLTNKATSLKLIRKIEKFNGTSYIRINQVKVLKNNYTYDLINECVTIQIVL
jgi:hypothetical protein